MQPTKMGINIFFALPHYSNDLCYVVLCLWLHLHAIRMDMKRFMPCCPLGQRVPSLSEEHPTSLPSSFRAHFFSSQQFRSQLTSFTTAEDETLCSPCHYRLGCHGRGHSLFLLCADFGGKCGQERSRGRVGGSRQDFVLLV